MLVSRSEILLHLFYEFQAVCSKLVKVLFSKYLLNYIKIASKASNGFPFFHYLLMSISKLGFSSPSARQASITSDIRLSLAEFKDEQAWPQLQIDVYEKILGLWFYNLQVKSSAILIFKSHFSMSKINGILLIFFSLKNIKKGDIFS